MFAAFAAVARLDPAGIALESDRAGAQREPALVADDQIDSVGIAGDELAVFGRVVLDRRRIVDAGRPLAEVHAVRAPFQHSAADQAAPLLEVEAVEQPAIERPPGRGPEVHVPIDLFLGRLRLGGGPAAHRGSHPGRMGVDGPELAEPAGAGQLAGEGEVGEVPPLRAGLENPARAAHRLGQRQALHDVLGAGLLAVHVLARLRRVDRGRRVPVRSRGDEHRVDVGAGQQLAEVVIRRAVLIAVLLIGHFLDGRAACRLDVGNGDELHVRLLQKAPEVVAAPVSDADAAQCSFRCVGHDSSPGVG